MEYILATKRFAGPNKIQIILKQNTSRRLPQYHFFKKFRFYN